jgi:hypothetical protein
VAKHYPPNWVLRYGWPVFIAQTLWGFVALRHGALFSYLAGKVDGLGEFRKARGKHYPSSPGGGQFSATIEFSAIIELSEKQIRDIQQATGFDLYWRLYFALT